MRKLPIRVTGVGLGLLLIGVIVVAQFTFDIELSNIRPDTVQPGNKLKVSYYVAVTPGEEEADESIMEEYQLEDVSIVIQLWKYGTIDETPVTIVVEDGDKAVESTKEHFVIPEAASVLERTRSETELGYEICRIFNEHLQEDVRWNIDGSYKGRGPADGFFLLFKLEAQGWKGDLPVFGSAQYAYPLEHERLCG